MLFRRIYNNNSRIVVSYLQKTRHFSKNYTLLNREHLILGIETSCDDTGCAIMDTQGNILGESLNSQVLTHLRNGGILPPIAQALHRENIDQVVNAAIRQAKIRFEDLSAIAVTVKPGLPLSLSVGTMYGKYLCYKYKKPFIPIHHMEAHALTARMHDKSLEFPFLVLLISGGHCLIAVAEGINKFSLLGTTIDDAPGEAFDKVARRMKLVNVLEYSRLCGGSAIELAASKATNFSQFEFGLPLTQHKDCNFSVAGIKSQLIRHLELEEAKHDVPPDGLIPDVNNLCAGFQFILTKHLCHRVQRAMTYVETEEMIPEEKRNLVVSGGVACNNFIARGLKLVCDEMGYNLIRPPPKLCTDNGIMIAWNGVEKWKSNLDILYDFDGVEIEKSAPFGKSLIDHVIFEQVKCKWVKLKSLTEPV